MVGLSQTSVKNKRIIRWRNINNKQFKYTQDGVFTGKKSVRDPRIHVDTSIYQKLNVSIKLQRKHKSNTQ